MTTKPNEAWLYGLDPVPTGAQHFTALDDFWNYFRQQIGADQRSTVAIATDTLTPTLGEHLVDTEASAATDDLANILATNIDSTRTFYLRLWAADPARVVTVKHQAGGAGQISLADSADYVLDEAEKWILLQYRPGAATWFEVARSRKTATQAEAEAGTDDERIMTPLKVNQAIVSLVADRPNLAMNGRMEVYQRARTYQGNNTSGYALDNYAMLCGNYNATCERNAAVPGTGFRYAIVAKRDSGETGTTGALGLEQPFETADIVAYWGAKLSMLFYGFRGSNFSGANNELTVQVFAGTGPARRRAGSAYTSESVLMTETITLGDTMQPFALTTASEIPIGTTQLTVFWLYQPTGTAGTFDLFGFSNVTICPGDTPGAAKPKSYTDDLLAARRFWQSSYAAGYPPGGINTAGIVQVYSVSTSLFTRNLNFDPPMHAAPAMTGYSPATGAAGYYRDYTANVDRAIAFQNGNEKHVCIQFGGATSPMNAGAHWVANAEL